MCQICNSGFKLSENTNSSLYLSTECLRGKGSILQN